MLLFYIQWLQEQKLISRHAQGYASIKRQNGWGGGCQNITVGTARGEDNTRLANTELQQWPLDIFINTANILILDKGWEENFRKCGQTKHDPFLAQDPGKKKPSFKKTNLEDEEIHWQ